MDCPFKQVIFLLRLVEGVDNVSEPSNELSVVGCIPEISQCYLFILKTPQFLDVSYFFQVGTDSLLADYVCQKCD